MTVAIITGSGGLIGSEAAEFFARRGMQVVGIDNDMRRYFFGDDASTGWRQRVLRQQLDSAYTHEHVDIRDYDTLNAIFKRYGKAISLVIHTAAQPSHDWAAKEPRTDFSVNANGTLNLLEATRQHAPHAVFIFTSTNKVYGDMPNTLPLVEQDTRYEIDPAHPYAGGIPESMPIDQSLHSIFGVGKVAADVMVQEYGRYFGLQTVCLRGGCLTGPNHAGAQLHGFLAYLMKCTVTSTPYTIFGYKGKQVRDNIHSADFIRAINAIYEAPQVAAVYNMGGGRESNCSMREAITLCEEIAGRELDHTYSDDNRLGDHIWYISDLSKFKADYPGWQLEYDVPAILREIYERNRDRWGVKQP